MDVQIIALDIDGTLTDDRKNISNLTLEALIEAEKKGIRLVLASARPAPGLFSIRDQLKMEQFGGILMSYNGGRITDCSGNTFCEISMDLTTTRRILRFLEELPVTVIVDDGKMFYVTDKSSGRKFLICSCTSYIFIGSTAKRIFIGENVSQSARLPTSVHCI